MCNLNRSKQFRTYLVGGAVRDWLLGRIPREYDFSFDADATSFLQRNPSARKVGKSVSVILLEGQEYMPLAGSVKEDLLRRDLTINALALESNGVLHSHPDALSDLAAGILRPASPTSFSTDPVRVFRLARFACEYPSFSVHPDAFAQMRTLAASAQSSERLTTPLAAIPAERVGRELLKAFAAPRPSRWLAVLAEGDCLVPWFADLEQAANIPAGPVQYHSGSVLAHLMDVMDAVAGDSLRVWMALCHDLGKLSSPTEMLPHHYGHERRGVAIAEQLAIRLGLPLRYRKAGALMSLLHMKAGIYSRLRPGTRCDLLEHIHASGLDVPFWDIVEADSGLDLREKVQHELDIILSVTLPLRWQNRGRESGLQLRLLRCQALRRG